MTALLSEQPSPGKISAVGLKLPSDLSFKDWLRVGKTLALAYFRDLPADGADDLHVRILDRNVPARKLRDAPYDPANLRLRDVL